MTLSAQQFAWQGFRHGSTATIAAIVDQLPCPRADGPPSQTEPLVSAHTQMCDEYPHKPELLIANNEFVQSETCCKNSELVVKLLIVGVIALGSG